MDSTWKGAQDGTDGVVSCEKSTYVWVAEAIDSMHGMALRGFDIIVVSGGKNGDMIHQENMKYPSYVFVP